MLVRQPELPTPPNFPPMSPRRERGHIPPEAVEHLRASDPILHGIIERVGPFDPAVEPDLWRSLLDSIVGQQLSTKAADAIMGRLATSAPGGEFPTPANLLMEPDETLQACGLSRAKVRYLHDLAEKWTDGTLEPDRIPAMSDEEVVEHLTRVKGIGRWTAEMVLIFTLQRPDVFPTDDLALRTAVQRAYRLDERPEQTRMLLIGEPWRPFRTAASHYLWRSLRLSQEAGG